MAWIKFKENQPIQQLSGTYCGMTFKTDKQGLTHVFQFARKRRPKADRGVDEAAYNRRRDIVDHCTSLIQQDMPDIRRAIKQREAITKRMYRLYDRYVQHYPKDDDKLIENILINYRQKRRKRRCESGANQTLNLV